MPENLKAGRYQIEEEIGRGGMGVVYRAHDTRLPRAVAIKMIPPEVGHDEQLRRRLAGEAKAASALNHPGIATVYDYVEQEGESFIVFEFVEGVTLREWMRAKRPSLSALLDVAVQIADALCAAHNRAVTHRDLKPENIMLAAGEQGERRVKILDFGLAKVQPATTLASDTAQTATVVTQPGFRVGTIHYMSPEQLEGDSADARADVHAFGVVLYELAAGTHPYAGRTAESVIANILKAEAPSLSGMPAELDRIVRKCLRKRREERYLSGCDLLVDLANLRREFVSGKSSAASVATPSMADARFGSMSFARNPARAVFAATQVGYLAIYISALLDLDRTAREAGYLFSAGGRGGAIPTWFIPLIIVLALVGILMRLYLLAAVSADFPNLGMNYRRLFPAVLLLDTLWAASPLLLFRKLGIGVAMGSVAALAYLPFVQRRLIYDAYLPGGGRSSGVTPASAA